MPARRPVRVVVPIIAALPALLLIAACGGPSAHDVGRTTVTSAPASNTTNADQSAQLEVARDRALTRADSAESLLAAQRERTDKLMAAIAERNAFEDQIWSQLDRVDARARRLRAEIPDVGLERRVQIQKGLASIASDRAKVDVAMHRLHRVPAAAWDSYKTDVERDVNALAREVEELQPPKR